MSDDYDDDDNNNRMIIFVTEGVCEGRGYTYCSY
jgi:hypothetical protein